MHHFEASEGTMFNYNSDLSGKVEIKKNGFEIELPGQDILEFVSTFVRNERISKIEELSTYEILGIDIIK